MMDMFFEACLLDWAAEGQAWQQLTDKLNQGSHVRIMGKETDLEFSIAGRKWLVLDGRINMPDGEIMTAPVNRSLDGHIYFEFPGVLGGRLIHDIRLTWQRGQLIEATASSHQDFLQKILATDAGASRLGEFAIGLNNHLRHFCKDILIDEKIGGTIHIALGRAYPECGGTNISAIHWDIVKDLRREGAVYLDGEVVLEQGQILI
jgi:aminopeptidase